MAQAFAIQYMIPDVAQYPHLRFDGDNVSDWIEQVDRIFERARLSDAQKIAEIQYWTKDRTHQKRVEYAIDQLDSWSTAVTALKSTFVIGDTRQLRSAHQRLKDLENQPPLSNPSKIYTYCLDHEILVSETKGTTRVPSDLDCTRGLFERIHSHSLEDIISKADMTYEEIFKMEYSQAQKLVRGWAKTKVDLENHNKRAKRYFPSDQGKKGQEESQPDVTALTERLRALEIRLNQVGPSDRRHQMEDIRTAYRPQQLWGCQPLVQQVVHQAQGNTVRTQDSPRQDTSRQEQLYDYETRQHRP
ncbi:uncharacterized protein BCR38DRAFT_481974 [Pseudomassariella vexata]|uniref:Uncharacterized protein n=1 Tax=Pseudomassariella vexata TaxID=1141098 RepID=A0A1Y2EAR4_9PEZI|nr:uncharacterized protein BCR38DRAFT_481974 [Pseudomassariella vexata]ORY68487.1 hypothetical protein BCR38DRAFT_481974 [Pseudomassariella vexata]